MTEGLLFSQMQPPAQLEYEFHDWYETDHIPARLRLQGFVRARRYEAIEGEPRYLACYEISGLDALRTPEYLALKASPGERTEHMLASVEGFTRYTCTLISDTGEPAQPGPVLSVVAFDVPEEDVAALDEWYETEHIPLLMRAEGWLRVRRYLIVDQAGPHWTHLALHELASEAPMASAERAQARNAPLRNALADRAWLQSSGRWLYREIGAARTPATA